MTDKPTYNARISELELEVGTITEWATNIEKAFGQILKSNLELNARVQMLEEKLKEKEERRIIMSEEFYFGITAGLAVALAVMWLVDGI